MRPWCCFALALLVVGCGSPTTDDWLRQLKDTDVVTRRQAIRELGARTAEGVRIVPALADALRDDNGYVRHDAATALGKFGPEAKDVVPALVVALKDKEHGVRTAAGAALKRIDPAAAKAAGVK
jgi:HEAT repeat protein